SDIDGETQGDASGSSVSLSSDGSIVAIGAINNDGLNGYSSGHVRIYRNIGDVWTQIGSDIDGETQGDASGSSVSLSSDGSIVAIGAINYDGINGSDSGHVRIYRNIGDIWTQIGSDIDGETQGDRSGSSVSLSSDGSTIAIGAPNNAENGINSGHVRVYDLTAVLSAQSFEQDYFTYYPNPVKNILNLKLNQGLELKQVNIYNIQNQYLYSVKTSKIDVRSLPGGIYFVEVITNEGKSTKKIVIE
uniref:T9SS type A sorting domain-containing protein n=1 Tax=uncultured Algibacter sp. TaxID=298659 RepID=UPI00261B0323